jgi:regulator of RNase E activity RraA
MSSATPANDPELSQFEHLQVSTLSDAMFALGLKDTALGPSVRLLVGKRILGRARTIGRVPLPSNGGQQEIKPEFSLAIQEVIDGCGPGSIMVIATQGIATHANWGGNMATRAAAVGALGLITDGAIRDLEEMGPLGMTIFAQGTSPRAGFATAIRNEPVICAGVLIRPGDIIVGDADGVIVIDPAQAGAIAAKAHELVEVEEEMQGFMRTGATLQDAVRKYKVR